MPKLFSFLEQLSVDIPSTGTTRINTNKNDEHNNYHKNLNLEYYRIQVITIMSAIVIART